jgi:hypothetical protein
MRLWIIILTFFCALSAGAAPATYYVATNGLDANPGTIGSPFRTIQKGVNTALAGDTVKVATGQYAENVTSARSGGVGTPIIIDGQGVATNWSFLTTHSNIYLFNFFLAGKASAWWFWMGKGAHDCIISNTLFDGGLNGSASILLRWDNPIPGTEAPFGGNCASRCLIISNEFLHVAGTTVIQSYGDNNTFIGNWLHDSDAVDWFHVFGRTNYVVSNVCSNDYISGNFNNHPDFFQIFGSGNGGGAKGIIVESNLVVKMDEDAQICMFEGQDNPDLGDVTFRNNLFIGVAAKGTAAAPDIKWYNNTFINCSTNTITAGAVLIFTSAEWTGSVETPPGIFTNYTASTGIGGRAYNNVFFNCGGTNSTGGTNTDRGWYVFSSDLTNISADYNFVTKNGYKAVDVDAMHRHVGDAGGWNKYALWEDHGINGGDPWFYNETNDLRLQATSLLIGVGTNGLVTTDFRGVPRGTATDIGAFEYLDPLTYLATNPVPCDLETRTLMGFPVSASHVISIVWPTNQYRNALNVYRRNFTNAPGQWLAWTSVYTNTSNPTFAGLWNDTNVTSGTHYEYQLIAGSTNSMCGTNGIDFGYKGFEYMNAGVNVPLREQRGSVILLCESGITNALVTELGTLVSDMLGDGYKVFRHDIAAVDVTAGATWFTAVTNTKALILSDLRSGTNGDFSIFIVGHVPIPYSGDSSPGFHANNIGAHPADWFYADTNAASWTDSTVNDSTSDYVADHNTVGDGKFDQDNIPTTPELRIGRVDLRNLPAFPISEVELLRQYLNRNHQWRHRQFTVRDRALMGTNSSVTVPPYECWGTYSQLFGNGTNFDIANWITTSTNAAHSYLMASSHGNASFTNDLLLGRTIDFASNSLYSAFNSIYGSYYGDWDSSQHADDVAWAPVAATGYTLGLYYREQQVNINPSSMGEPYADDLWFLSANFFVGSSAQYLQTGYWYTNGSTFLNPQRLANYTTYFGDPTLRIRQVGPPTNAAVVQVGSDNVVSWTASTDSGVAGYHVYRAPSSDLNAYARLTSTLTTSPYTNSGAAGTPYIYSVRAVKLDQSAGRSFFNASQGAFASVNTTLSGPNLRKLNKIRLKP